MSGRRLQFGGKDNRRSTGSIEIAQVPLQQQHNQMTNSRSLIARQSKYKLCHHNPALG